MWYLVVASVVLVLLAAPAGTPLAQQESITSGSFSPAGSLAEARWAHTATLLLDGRILVIGGAGKAAPRGGVGRYRGTTPPLMEVRASAEIWDPAIGTFQATGSLAGPRAGHAALLLPDGRVLVIGGWSADGRPPVATADVWDPATGEFTSAGSLATGRIGHTVTLLPDGRVLVVGGNDGRTDHPTTLATAEMWDPVSGEFAPAGKLDLARTGHTATLLPDGRVLIVGGVGRSRAAKTGRTAEVWSPDRGTFEPAGEMTGNRRIGHTATLLLDGRVAVMGGSDTGGTRGPTDVEVWDATTRSFTPAGSLSDWRYGHQAVVLDDGRVLLDGGVTPASRVEVWDPATGSSTPAEPRTPEVLADTVTTLRDGRVLLAGGEHESTLDTAARWDPATGMLEPSGVLSDARQDHTATLLPDGRVLLVGGIQRALPTTGPDGSDRVLSSAEIWTPVDAAFG